jgi:hypothetical protein
MEIVTEYLSELNLELELKYILAFCNSHSLSTKIMFGDGCNVSVDKLYEFIPVSNMELPDIVYGSIEKEIVRVGSSDLYIYDDKDKYNFRLCHECDIHFESEDKDLIAKVESHWKSQGFKTQPFGYNPYKD